MASHRASYSIENAKSGRASCKKCKEKIGKGELRIGENVDNGEFITTKWFKVPCFTLPRKLKQQGITEETFVESHLEDNSEDHVLSDDAIVATIVKQIATKPKAANSKKAGVKRETNVLIATLKRNSEILLREEDAEKDDGPATKKLKSSLSSTDHLHASAYLEYVTLKVDDLKDFLRWNRQPLGGIRLEILSRVIDGHVHGRIGRCTSCTKGKLKLSDDGLFASCSGYFDEDAGRRIPCFNKLPLSKIPRVKPWYQSEPSEEEAELMDTIPEQQLDGGSGGDNSCEASNLLSAAAEKLEWDLSTPLGMKKAAKDMLEICAFQGSSVDLPEPESRVRIDIGKIIISNRSKSAVDIIGLVIAKYGMKEAKKEATRAKSEARESSCCTPANLPIMEVMLELGDLYTKESNYNAGNTYKKVAAAIKDLGYEITKHNAKGIGKGKTKVAGIGKSSSDKVFEFLTTGKIQKLEDKRAAFA